MRKIFSVAILAVLSLIFVFSACSPTDCFVTFDAQNGDAPQTLKYNDAFVMPADPVNGDKIFGGWYTDESCSDATKWYAPKSISQNITVFAKWTNPIEPTPQYFVVFELQNGEDAVFVKCDESFAIPADPTNGNKIFGGWFADSDCTIPWTYNQTATDNTVVYAKWSDYSEDGKIVKNSDMFYLPYKENFKIVQFADVQSSTMEQLNAAFADLDKLVAYEKPDLIVCTGDNIDSRKGHAGKDVFLAFVAQMEKYGIPWCPVYGNHDAEIITKDYMGDEFIKAKHCLFSKGPADIHGSGNYVVNLVNNDETEIVYSIILLDSNMYRTYPEGGGYDYIYPDQIDWYASVVNDVKNQNHGKIVPSLAYFHIPLPEYWNARAALKKNSQTEGDLIKSPLGWGVFLEKVVSNGVADISNGITNTGLFSRMVALGSTKGVICGHNHANNCDINYDGVRLCFGLKASRTSWYHETLLGCSVVTLPSNGNFVMYNTKFADIPAVK